MPMVTEVYLSKQTTKPIVIKVEPTMRQQTNSPPMRASHLKEIPSEKKWSTCKRFLVCLLILLIVGGTIAAIVLAVVLTRKTQDSTTTATTTPLVSTPIVSAYWTFDSVTSDFYGTYNGQLVNGATYIAISTTQPYLGNGQALSLSSSLNQSFLVSFPFLNFSFTSFTIEAWIYSFTTNTGDYSIFGQCQCVTCPNQCLYLIIRQNLLCAGFTLGNLVTSSLTISTNTWYHIAFVYNYQSQQQILYINGNQDTMKSNIGPYQGLNGSIQIGTISIALAPNYFNGYIDNVKVTTRAKSSVEILNDASLTAYYSFDSPAPNVDNGPNGYNGTSLNTMTVTGRVNQAMYFIGSSSYFQTYGFYQAGYGVQSGKPFSISMWINPISVASSHIVTQSTNQLLGPCLNMIGFYSARNLAGQLTVQASTYIVLFGPFIQINTWTHFSWTYSSMNGHSLYVNGIYFGSTGGFTLSVSGSIAWFNIGNTLNCSANQLSNNGYQGSTDEVYIHNRELTQSAVNILANP